VKKSSVVALATLAGFGIGTAWAGEPIHVTGKNICKTIEQHQLQVEGDPDHVLIVVKGSCTTTATGRSARFDGGKFTSVETDDLVNGTGMIRGYDFEVYKDHSTEADSYAGLMITTVVNGKPQWSGQGTWEMMRGTGSLANAQQRGTWKAVPTSDTEYVINWEGTLTE
jgi:hypothetical protein